MTNSSVLTLACVGFNLPDGRALLTGLSYTFDARTTGLVGRNGIGKSVLARLLAGQLVPGTGTIRAPVVHYLPQQLDPAHYRDVAELAGIAPVLSALQRIEAGSCDEADFALVGDRWDIRSRLAARLNDAGLGHLHADTPAASLSGGECTRVALIGALLSDADFLILDEPSNHLDARQRRLLHAELARWPRGLLVISHDRDLLRQMACIVELSEAGLTRYGGNYDFYTAAKAQEQDAAVARLEHARTAQRRGEADLQLQAQKQAQRVARGNRSARDSNQAKILLGMQQQRCEQSSGRLQQQGLARRDALAGDVAAARGQVQPAAELLLMPPDAGLTSQKQLLALDALRLPFGDATPIDLHLSGPRRLALVGANGCGKSTLLKVLAGQLAPAGGDCRVHLPPVYLDQHAGILCPDSSVLAQLQRHNPALGEGEARTRLALLGLDTARALQPAGLLSGGERLKAALACVLYAERPAQLLLLDEPTNHLDLAGIAALERMLRQYRGALLVVSHDEDFLGALSLDGRVVFAAGGGVTLTAGDGVPV
ncbi:ABC transporter ATP-binding protein [Jeongeupia sp. HS-3]|uniref:ABC-F family ATP-binding cassette domain-containing protein n=1 Tax=Jeongeupia sp. HS-3 TaxID=1009682 RepID=UPI0018A34B86|nr:ABC-F family ATP-binding cassette domain-containing protein [Jeongeupia sp. HS-3]BCL74724.1 ABC transporter ATP-binding protein [Jeongeupia sp. HS-3]